MDKRFLTFFLVSIVLLSGCNQDAQKATSGGSDAGKSSSPAASPAASPDGSPTGSPTVEATVQTTVVSSAADNSSETFNVPPINGAIIPASEDSATPVEVTGAAGNTQAGSITATPVELAAPEFPKPTEEPAASAPSESATPAEPTEPTEPALSAESAAPAEPALPSVPESTSESAAPAVPTEPVAPALPEEPAASATPTEPAAPALPEEPALPSVPESTSEPAAPAAPAEPATPALPEEPALPSVPESTSEPAAPAEPATPALPEEPALPSVPESTSEPATPALPNETPGIDKQNSTDESMAKTESAGSTFSGNRIPQPTIVPSHPIAEMAEEELSLSSVESQPVRVAPAAPAPVPPVANILPTSPGTPLGGTEPPVPLVVKPIDVEPTANPAVEQLAEELPTPIPDSPVDQQLADKYAATGNPLGALPVEPAQPAGVPATLTPMVDVPAATTSPTATNQTATANVATPRPTATNPAATANAATASPSTPVLTSGANVSALANDTNANSYDPIRENGPIFVDWPKPIAALVITGQQMGYLEPCGCAGLDRMKGGLSRRYTMIDQLRKAGWNVVPIDVGGMVEGFGKQAELKFHTTAQAMRAMGYKSVALGKGELGFPAADLLSEMVNPDGTPGMFVSCNASVFEKDAETPPQVKIVQAGPLKFGITSVLCKSGQNYTQNDEIILSDTSAALKKAVAKLKSASDIRILLSHGTPEEAQAIAADFPDLQIIVTAGGAPEPPARPTILPSGQYIITVGQKGMNAVVLALFADGKVRYQRVHQDSRFAQSEIVRGFMQSYQDQLKELWLAGLGIKPVPQTDKSLGAYTGPKKCATCHEQQYDIWRKTKHATAFSSLEKAAPPRQYDPECVCCHVVGWHRHLYFPYKTGFLDHQKDEHLKNVSCEACHGPGEAHIQAEASNNTQLQEEIRKKLHIDLDYAKTRMCGDCHDLDNSPEFEFDKYWPQIMHNNNDEEDEP